jgi:predicted transcriptional regulator of viral defense system
MKITNKNSSLNSKYSEILQIFKKHNGYARMKDILARKIHVRDIRKLLKEGIITKVKNGLYRLSDVPIVSNQSFIDLSQAVPSGVICLLSALSYYDLTTFQPSVVSMAIHQKTWKPKIEYPPVEFYYFSTKQFNEGIDEIKINGHKVRIYCPEKTIADCFRYRNKRGIDVVKEGLSEYLKLIQADLATFAFAS